MEDDPLLRMLAVELVEDAGFDTLGAGNADEAVGLLESDVKIALLFTDIDMPGSMDGLKLAHTVHDRWPLIKILIVSGKLRQICDLPPNSCFVGKPYQTDAIISELRSLTGSRH